MLVRPGKGHPANTDAKICISPFHGGVLEARWSRAVHPIAPSPYCPSQTRGQMALVQAQYTLGDAILQ